MTRKIFPPYWNLCWDWDWARNCWSCCWLNWGWAWAGLGPTGWGVRKGCCCCWKNWGFWAKFCCCWGCWKNCCCCCCWKNCCWGCWGANCWGCWGCWGANWGCCCWGRRWAGRGSIWPSWSSSREKPSSAICSLVSWDTGTWAGCWGLWGANCCGCWANCCWGANCCCCWTWGLCWNWKAGLGCWGWGANCLGCWNCWGFWANCWFCWNCWGFWANCWFCWNWAWNWFGRCCCWKSLKSWLKLPVLNCSEAGRLGLKLAALKTGLLAPCLVLAKFCLCAEASFFWAICCCFSTTAFWKAITASCLFFSSSKAGSAWGNVKSEDDLQHDLQCFPHASASSEFVFIVGDVFMRWLEDDLKDKLQFTCWGAASTSVRALTCSSSRSDWKPVLLLALYSTILISPFSSRNPYLPANDIFVELQMINLSG